jgi:dolichol-phosphate mannosyltransferase
MANYRVIYGGKTLEFDNIKALPGRKEVSVILPTYNEEELIAKLIDSIIKNLKGYDYEIIIADDASKDKTPEIIDSYAKKYSVVALHRYINRGILKSILDAIKLSRGKTIVLMDADFSHPPEKIPELLKYIPEYDFVSGSRFVKGSKIITPFSRKAATVMLNTALRIILGLKPHDLTGVFHAIKKEKFNQLQLKYPAVWGEFDMELFYEASRKKFKIKEVPFTYDFRKEGVSKSENLLKYGRVYLSRAVKIRLFR